MRILSRCWQIEKITWSYTAWIIINLTKKQNLYILFSISWLFLSVGHFLCTEFMCILNMNISFFSQIFLFFYLSLTQKCDLYIGDFHIMAWLSQLTRKVAKKLEINSSCLIFIVLYTIRKNIVSIKGKYLTKFWVWFLLMIVIIHKSDTKKCLWVHVI